jgi:ribosomal protein L37AE/L43A
MSGYLSWNCDFCGKAALVVSSSGVVYCSVCGKSDGHLA